VYDGSADLTVWVKDGSVAGRLTRACRHMKGTASNKPLNERKSPDLNACTELTRLVPAYSVQSSAFYFQGPIPGPQHNLEART
jgi:hypothetical protein